MFGLILMLSHLSLVKSQFVWLTSAIMYVTSDFGNKAECIVYVCQKPFSYIC
jgi:hypothetical protein